MFLDLKACFSWRRPQLSEFWSKKKLHEMNEEEWESLCDGCARCCLHKFEEVQTKNFFYTSVVCRYLEQSSCSCSEYSRRQKLVSTCVKMTSDNLETLKWMPSTCAYRKISEGKPLDWWHHLISGSRETVHEAGISVKEKCVSELHVHADDIEDQKVHWVHP